jgi:hypothetical protein
MRNRNPRATDESISLHRLCAGSVCVQLHSLPNALGPNEIDAAGFTAVRLLAGALTLALISASMSKRIIRFIIFVR